MRQKNSGIALLTALGMLVVFSLLGGAYLTYMLNEEQSVNYDLAGVRARAAAETGLQQAIADVGATLAAGKLVPTEAHEQPVALYKGMDDGGVAVDDSRTAKVTVQVWDEASRINVNYAPTRVLAAILGVDPNTARLIRSQMPRLDGDDAAVLSVGNARWLASVDELQTRGPTTVKAPANLLTVYTGETGTNAGWLNVNSALPEALAAVLDVPVDQAKQIKQAGPFTSIEQLAAAAGKDPSTFNVRPTSPGTLPKELSFSSRCYRIASVATYTENGIAKTGSRIEAVVYYDPNGRPEIRSWNETQGKEQTTDAANAA
jgi:type II secretory pathway component PulK